MRRGLRQTDSRRGLPSLRWLGWVAAALCWCLPLAGCPGDRPEASQPEGALSLFLQAMRTGDRERAYALLAPTTQEELTQRAQQATREGGRTIEPAEMLAVERFVQRWEPQEMTSRVEGTRAVVTVRGPDEQRAEVTLVKVEAQWRVLLPL
jgi:hypothetical protein